MPDAIFQFPKGFLWGAAVSSHQVEGQNTNNNWSQFEQQEGRIKEGHTAGLACDWWGGRWKEDLDRAQEMGLNAFRFSLEWSRIQPSEDRWDEHALDRYRDILMGMNDRGLFPLVTLHHFTDPLWITEQGGWENPKIVNWFESYASKVVKALGEHVTTWSTINEPNVVAAMGYMIGEFPPGGGGLSAGFAVMENQMRAHAAAYHAIHRVQKQARVGLVQNYRGFSPKLSWSPFDRFLAGQLSKIYNDFHPMMARDGKARLLNKTIQIPEAKGTQDYLGLNYYTVERVSFDPRKPDEIFSTRDFNPDSELSPGGFLANEPDGLTQSIKWGMQFNVPMIVTENGTEDAQDDFRRRYMIQHIHKLWREVNFNHPVKGYFYWSLVDNFEWAHGWTARFGLWELDPETQARRKRPSADLYSAIAKANGLSSEMVREHAPELIKEIFPG